MAMFATTKRLADAVSLMNGLEARKFPLLLRRIVAKLHERGSGFTDAEQDKLAAMLSLAGAELATVLEACSYIFEKAVYEGAKSSKLQGSLQAVGLSEGCVAAFAAVWAEGAAAAKEKAKQKTIAGPRVLSSFAWRTNMHLAKSSTAKLKEQSAIFDFTTRPADAGAAGGAAAAAAAAAAAGGEAGGSGVTAGGSSAVDGTEQFAVELSHDELYQFFLDLERIQAQLDALGGGGQ